MKLRIRYENEYQELELDADEMEQLWLSLSLEGDDLTEEEKEEKVQEAWEERFNRPDYNCWHRETRRIDQTPKPKLLSGKRGNIQPERDEAYDPVEYLLVTDDTEKIEEDQIRSWVREALRKKPEWVDAFIAVRMDGESIRHYAARKGTDENIVTQKLKRAEKKLREHFKNRQVF